jgi:hypothetical protein
LIEVNTTAGGRLQNATHIRGAARMASKRFRFVFAASVALGVSGCATTEQHVEPHRDIECFQRARVTLAEAIGTAERTQGQMVIDAEYNCAAELDCLRGNPGQYRVTLYAEGRLNQIGICPAAGVVQPVVKKGTFRRVLDLDFIFDWPQSEMLKSGPVASTAATTMRDAIATAEATGGKAMAAHVKSETGKARYVIELVDKGRMRVVSVDLESGTVVR